MMYGMRYSSTITSKGTITIPAEIRAVLGLHPGEQVGIDLDSKTGKITVKKSPTLTEVRAMNKRRMAELGIKPGITVDEIRSMTMKRDYGHR